MTKRRLILAGVVAAIAATTLLGGGLRTSSGAPPAMTRIDVGGGRTEAAVARLQSKLRRDSADEPSYVLLGLAYQQRARETGDPTYYARSEGALRRALRLAPSDPLALSGLGSLALARHRFAEALRLGRQARALAPATARHYGVVGDALVELGRYDEAFEAFDAMARLKPGLASYARVSYARELLGDLAGASSALRLGLAAATGEPEPTAWTRVQLGKLYWSAGRLANAVREYRAALAAFPGYVYALDGLAQAEAARGRLQRAIRLEARAVAQVPLPQFAATLGDLHRRAGRTRESERQYALVGAIERLLVANSVKTDLETALFSVDHGRHLPHALELARRAHSQRPSIDGDDVLAWALARNGRCDEALRYSRRALRLGTLDALKFFHRGMIERCLGDHAQARLWFGRALRLNPHFSLLWAPVAREALR